MCIKRGHVCPWLLGLQPPPTCTGSFRCKRVQDMPEPFLGGKIILHVATGVLFLKFISDIVIP